MDDSNMETTPSNENTKQYAVYFEQSGYIQNELWSPVKKTKNIEEFMNSVWKTWYEESIIDGEQPKIIFHARHVGLILSRKHKISVRIGDVSVKVFETDNPTEKFDVSIDLPKNVNLQAIGALSVSYNVQIHPMHFISPHYNIGNRFVDSNRPYNVVLKFDDNVTLYGNKVVLALWSNYFDRLFFSSLGSIKETEFVIKDVNGSVFERLLNMCLNRNQEFYIIDESFPIAHIDTAYKLQMIVPLKVISECGQFDKCKMNEILPALRLSELLNLADLRNFCQYEFRNIQERKKKEFLIENEKELGSLSINTCFRFLNAGINEDSENDFYDDFLPELKEPEPYWDEYKKGVNTRQDVCLLVGEERFEVHKEYLAFWSPYFDRLFFGDFIEKEMSEMEIKEIDPQKFGTLLRLIYPPGDVKIDDSNVAFLLKLADRFEIKSVLIMCCSYLERKAKETESNEDIMNVLELADQYFLIDAQIPFFKKMSTMPSDDSKKLRSEYHGRMCNLSEETKNNIILGA